MTDDPSTGSGQALTIRLSRFDVEWVIACCEAASDDQELFYQNAVALAWQGYTDDELRQWKDALADQLALIGRLRAQVATAAAPEKETT